MVITIVLVSCFAADHTSVKAQENLTARVLVKAVHTAVLSSQIAGRVNAVPLLEGQSFKEGDLLVGFDCDLMQARVEISHATLSAEAKSLENKRKLLKLQSIGDLEVALGEIAVRKAQGELKAARYIAEQCKILAPFPGRVVLRNVQPHETVAPGDPLLSVLDDSTLELELVLPSSWLSWLKNGHEFNVAIDETGDMVPATIERLAARVDPVSQTVNAYARFSSEAQSDFLVAGMSGTAFFNTTAN